MKPPEDSIETEDLLDRLVAEHADRLARDEDPRREEVLAEHPELRDDLLRCFRMIEAGLAAPQPSTSLQSGLRLGEFRILREIGRGGMGVVYLAEQPSLRRPVALKVLRHHLTLESRHVARFRREAETAARLRHPNVVAIHAVGEQDGHHYLAMDLVEGPTLARVIRDLAAIGRRPTAAELARATGARELETCGSYAEAAARFLLPVLDAVQAAHDVGLVHRDLKPSNILLDGRGRPHVADFGLAKGEGDAALSLSGEPIGTPHYMSPEQAHASAVPIGARSDVYSLGVVLFELLTLRVPFEGRTAHEVIQRILTEPPPRPRSVARDLPPALESVIVVAMTKDPACRYASPRAMAEDLERFLAGRPVAARPRRTTRFAESLASFLLMGQTWGIDYRSKLTLFGRPLVHVAFGLDPFTGRMRIARGIVAIGNVAIGGLALGGISVGLVSLGGLGAGLLVGIGGLGMGGLALGGVAIGLVALGGGAAGLVAVGGGAAGYYASGGSAWGAHVLDATTRDPEAVRFFEQWFPHWAGLLTPR